MLLHQVAFTQLDWLFSLAQWVEGGHDQRIGFYLTPGSS